jgi:hypothetical protein
MGLTQNSHKIFLTVADGKLVQKVDKDTPGAISYEKEDKTVIYQLKHSGIEGFLIGVNVTEKEFNGKKVKQFNFDIEDSGQVYQLQIKYSSGYSTSLLKALLNPDVNLALPVKITPWAKTVNDKKKTSMYLSQNGEDIKWYFTKETPNGLPEMKKVRISGEDKWDDYDMMQYFEAQIKSEIIPNLPKVGSSGKPSSGMQPSEQFTPPSGTPVDPNNAPDEDDLPF